MQTAVQIPERAKVEALLLCRILLLAVWCELLVSVLLLEWEIMVVMYCKVLFL
jgi:hypothetical protein